MEKIRRPTGGLGSEATVALISRVLDVWRENAKALNRLSQARLRAVQILDGALSLVNINYVTEITEKLHFVNIFDDAINTNTVLYKSK